MSTPRLPDAPPPPLTARWTDLHTASDSPRHFLSIADFPEVLAAAQAMQRGGASRVFIPFADHPGIEAWCKQHLPPSLWPDDAEAGHHHGVVIDLDEAAHGLWAAIKSSSGGLGQKLSEDAVLMARAPMSYLADGASAHSAADLGMSTIIAGVLAPLAGMALKAGVEEWREAGQTKKAVKARQAQVDQALEGLDHWLKKEGVSPAQREALIQRKATLEQHQKDLAFQFQQASDDRGIGASSTASGFSILSKAVMDVGVKTTTFATGGAAGLATAAGIVGTFVLGPFAAIGAGGLGHFMVKKSRAKKQQVREDRDAVLKRFEADAKSPDDTPELQTYRAFIGEKMRQRLGFYRGFKRSNKGFRIGAAIYGAGALVKPVLVVLAMAGVAAVASPAVMAILLVSGIVGGVTMGIFSHQFLTGHGRQHRYQNYFLGDDRELDRQLMSRLAQERQDPQLGLRARASFFTLVEQRENIRQRFMREVAALTGKHASLRVSSTDHLTVKDAKLNDQESKPREPLALGLGLRKGLPAFASSLLRDRNLKQARSAAREAVAKASHELKPATLAAWLGTTENRAHQAQWMLNTLATQLDYLDQKARAEGDLPGSDPGWLPNAQALRQPAQILLETLRTVPVSHLSAERWAQLTDTFVQLQEGKEPKPFDAAANTPALAVDRLCHYLTEGAPQRYKDLRGLAVEMEMQVAREARDTQENAPTSPASSAPPVSTVSTPSHGSVPASSSSVTSAATEAQWQTLNNRTWEDARFRPLHDQAAAGARLARGGLDGPG